LTKPETLLRSAGEARATPTTGKNKTSDLLLTDKKNQIFRVFFATGSSAGKKQQLLHL